MIYGIYDFDELLEKAMKNETQKNLSDLAEWLKTYDIKSWVDNGDDGYFQLKNGRELHEICGKRGGHIRWEIR